MGTIFGKVMTGEPSNLLIYENMGSGTLCICPSVRIACDGLHGAVHLTSRITDYPYTHTRLSRGPVYLIDKSNDENTELYE